MWELRIYNMKHFFDKKYHLMELVKEVDHEPDFGSNFEINGKHYRTCASSPKNKVMGIEEIHFADEVEDQHEDEFTCPYCLGVDSDAFELQDNGTIECGNCGSEIEFERVVDISYAVTPVKKNESVKL